MDAFKSLEVQYNMSYWSRKPDFFFPFLIPSPFQALSHAIRFVLFCFVFLPNMTQQAG